MPQAGQQLRNRPFRMYMLVRVEMTGLYPCLQYPFHLRLHLFINSFLLDGAEKENGMPAALDKLARLVTKPFTPEDRGTQRIPLRQIEVEPHLPVKKGMLMDQPYGIFKTRHISHQGSTGNKETLKAPYNSIIYGRAVSEIIGINNYLILYTHTWIKQDKGVTRIEKTLYLGNYFNKA